MVGRGALKRVMSESSYGSGRVSHEEDTRETIDPQSLVLKLNVLTISRPSLKTDWSQQHGVLLTPPPSPHQDNNRDPLDYSQTHTYRPDPKKHDPSL